VLVRPYYPSVESKRPDGIPKPNLRKFLVGYTGNGVVVRYTFITFGVLNSLGKERLDRWVTVAAGLDRPTLEQLFCQGRVYAHSKPEVSHIPVPGFLKSVQGSRIGQSELYINSNLSKILLYRQKGTSGYSVFIVEEELDLAIEIVTGFLKKGAGLVGVVFVFVQAVWYRPLLREYRIAARQPILTSLG